MGVSATTENIVKFFHLIAAAAWMGGTAALLILLYACQHAQSSGELFGILRGLHVVNVFVVMYAGAYGAIFTGLTYSVCTRRGFFRHRWIVCKWIIALLALGSGTIFLTKGITVLLEEASDKGLAALQQPAYKNFYLLCTACAVLHLLLFCSAVLVSLYKPREKKELRLRQNHCYHI